MDWIITVLLDDSLELAKVDHGRDDRGDALHQGDDQDYQKVGHEREHGVRENERCTKR